MRSSARDVGASGTLCIVVTPVFSSDSRTIGTSVPPSRSLRDVSAMRRLALTFAAALRLTYKRRAMLTLGGRKNEASLRSVSPGVIAYVFGKIVRHTRPSSGHGHGASCATSVVLLLRSHKSLS